MAVFKAVQMLVLVARTGSWLERCSVLLRTGTGISLPLTPSACGRVTHGRARLDRQRAERGARQAPRPRT